MQNGISTLQKSRIGFLLVLALGITLLFFKMIEGFVLSLLVAAILTGLMSPVYHKLVGLLRGRQSAAAILTVLLTLLIVIVPTILLVGAFVHQAAQVSEGLAPWIAGHSDFQEELRQKLDASPRLRKLIPYQDRIVAKVGQLAGKTAAFLSQEFATVAGGTVRYFMLLFIKLYAMLYFLQEGRALLDRMFNYTPLAAEDKQRLMSTFTSVAKATLKGTFVIGIVQGGLAGASFAVAGFNGALFWGAIMAVLSVIPGIGASLVWGPMIVYQAMLGHVGAAVGVGLWCALVVGTADNVLRPRLVGSSTQMPDLLVLLTTLGGLVLFGAAGIVIGPIVGALFTTAWTLWGAAIDEEKAADSQAGDA